MFNSCERSRLDGVVLVLAFEGFFAGLDPRLAEQPELPVAEFAPCPRHKTGESARPANSTPGVPSPSTSRSGDPEGAALTGLQLTRMGSSGVMDGTMAAVPDRRCWCRWRRPRAGCAKGRPAAVAIGHKMAGSGRRATRE